jgi:hypothetical protein
VIIKKLVIIFAGASLLATTDLHPMGWFGDACQQTCSLLDKTKEMSVSSYQEYIEQLKQLGIDSSFLERARNYFTEKTARSAGPLFGKESGTYGGMNTTQEFTLASFHAERYNPALEQYLGNEHSQIKHQESIPMDGSLSLTRDNGVPTRAMAKKLTEHLLYSKITEVCFVDNKYDKKQTTPHFTIFGLYRLTPAGKYVAGALVTTALAAAVYANYKICQKTYRWWKNRKTRQAKTD